MLGRVFFLAHFLLDTAAGAAVTLTTHAALTAGGVVVGAAAWWHAALAHAAFIALALAKKSKQA